MEIPGRLKQKAKIEKLTMLQENKKASKEHKTPQRRSHRHLLVALCHVFRYEIYGLKVTDF